MFGKKIEAVAKNEIFYCDSDIVEGSLKYQVIESSCYKNIFDAGIAYEDIHELKDLINSETGEMLENSVFVLVDMYVENENAVPQKDYKYSDDTTFRADYLTLADTSVKVTDVNFENYFVCYFSEAEKKQEHRYAFNLPQGESCNYKLGFIVFNDNVEDLYLCTTSGNVNSTFVDLDLQLEESE